MHLVNNQGQVWMGMFFAPGLAILNLVKLGILMYFRSWAVLTCNVPHEVIFRLYIFSSLLLCCSFLSSKHCCAFFCYFTFYPIHWQLSIAQFILYLIFTHSSRFVMLYYIGRASRSNNFYLALLLTMLFLCVLPVSYAIVWIEPSWHCGPFAHHERIHRVFTDTLKSTLPE